MEKIMVTKSFLPPFEEYTEEIKKIWETNWLTNMGPLHNEFKEKLKAYLKGKELSLFVNGHQALEIAIKSFDFPKGGEIITTPFTFASTTHAITNCDMVPVFCDIEEESFNLDSSKIEELINEKTVAILPVHVFGNPCDVEKIKEIGEQHNLKVIYDAAHTFGVEVNGKGIATFGDISMFSLHATKVFHSIEGGILSYGKESYYYKLKNLKNFGITGPERITSVGGNSKMNEFQAAMGIVNLKYIDIEIEKRKKIAERYREDLSDMEGIICLNDMDGIKHNYAYFPIIINEEKLGLDRNQVFEKLQESGIYTRKYFYPLVTDFECYKGKFETEDLKIAKKVAERVLTLPMYGSLKEEEIYYIIDKIKSLKK